MYNVRRTGRNTPTQDLVSVDAVRNIVKEMTNPMPKEKIVAGDGLAYRAYYYNILKPNKKN